MYDYDEYHEYVNPSENAKYIDSQNTEYIDSQNAEYKDSQNEYYTYSEEGDNERFFGGNPFGPGPQYPGQQPQYPGQQPQYPGQQPQYPGQQPQYPGQQPQYPGQQPQYPGQPGGPSMGQAPTSPPPSVTPMKSEGPGLKAVDPGAIRGCLYRYTYIWPRFGFPYWFYPTYVGRRSVSGYKWNGFMWHYYGTDLRSIDSFSCY